MHDRRLGLGGYVPTRVVRSKPLALPDDKTYATVKKGSGQQSIATTMAFVRLLKDLMRDKELGKRFVLIAPDEYRTFGMDSFFPSAKIYNPLGQQYESVDRGPAARLQGGAERADAARRHLGGRLHGLADRGRVGVRHARRAAHPGLRLLLDVRFPAHRRPVLADGRPVVARFRAGRDRGPYDSDRRGPPARRRPLAAAASTNPACVAYDPAFGFEIAHIVGDGVGRRMYGGDEQHPHGEDVFYYLTVYNEPIRHPAEPANVDVEGILKGIHRFSEGTDGSIPAQIMASGVAVPWAVEAQADPRRGVERTRRRLVGDLLERAAARGGGVRGAQSAASRGGAAGAVRDAEAGRCAGTVRGRVRLDAVGSGPDRAMGAGDAPVAGRGRVRFRGHARCGTALLPHRRGVDL